MRLTSAQFINEVKKSIKYENRFFVNEEFNKYLSDLCSDRLLIKNFEKDSSLYRARIYNKSDKIKRFKEKQNDEKIGDFIGFNAEESFVQKDLLRVGDGRCNPKYIPYLYTATDIETAIKEIRPQVYSAVSVAEIKINETLKILNLSENFAISSDKWMADFKSDINYEISLPYYEDGDYLLTQYISEYIKNKGFDGFAYRSSYVSINDKLSYNEGTCVLIFNYNKCEAINSKLYLINNFTVEWTEAKNNNKE